MTGYVVGGGKTGYNLYQFFRKNGIDSVILYYFPGEYADRKKVGKSFEAWKGMKNHDENSMIIITSETAFNQLTLEDQKHLPTHYLIRDKENFEEIASQIGIHSIPSFTPSNVQYPAALKPKDAMQKKVPFKFKKIKHEKELERFHDFLNDCILQPFLSEKEYSQIAIAGYFDGNPGSMIAVEQRNHYPKGISAFVINRTVEHHDIIGRISEYLNEIKYNGFIEMELKKHKVSGEFYLMDINPRPWGWFYYYLDGIQNFEEFWFQGHPLQIKLKKCWVNFPRLVMANLKGEFSNPSLSDILTRNICYEPYF